MHELGFDTALPVGQHTNDKELSYYARTLSGFEWEVGRNPIVVDESLTADGRRQLMFIPGEVALPPFPRWAMTGAALRSVGSLADPTPSALPSLLAFAAPGHILYGSDFPFAPEGAGTLVDSLLDGDEGFAPGQLDAINRGNAEVLFPRLPESMFAETTSRSWRGSIVSGASYSRPMTYSVWHRGLGITLDLTEADLGHPEHPRLLDDIYGNYQPDLLYCLEAHEDEGFICPGFMAIRKVNGRPHAMHVAKGERPETKAESDLHKALGEYTAEVATEEGFRVGRPETSARGGRRTGLTVEGADSHRLGYEIQLAAIAGGSVDARTRVALRAGVTPLWLVNNENAIPIDRAPWARLNVQSWRDVTDRTALPVRGGVKQLHMSRCDWSNPVPCPRRGAGRCGGRHGRWEPVRGLYYDDVVRRTATGELVPLYMPHPAGRRGWHMWVTPADKEEFLEGRPEPVPATRRTGGGDGDGLEAGIRTELARARDDEQPVDASLWHTEPGPSEFSRPFTVGEFVIPGDLVAARRTFTRALEHCADIAAHLPSAAAVVAGRAEITDDQRERLADARERCRRLAEEMHTHPWWETAGDRHAAREALTHAATHDHV